MQISRPFMKSIFNGFFVTVVSAAFIVVVLYVVDWI